MENASKALLIAGAILIAILLIAMGVKTFNSTKGTTDSIETTTDATEKAIHNNKFIPYIGENKTKSDAMSLANIVIASNASSGKTISVNVINNDLGDTEGNANGIMEAVSKLSSTGKYKITPSYEGGYIRHIEIKKIG